MIHEKLILETLNNLLNDSIQQKETLASVVEALYARWPSLSPDEKARLQELAGILRTQAGQQKARQPHVTTALTNYDQAKAKFDQEKAGEN